MASARASRADIDVWHGDARSEVRLDGLAASAGPGLRAGDWRIRAGGTARWDAVDSGPLVGGHGPWVALAWDRTRGSGAERRGGGVALEVGSALPALGAGYPLVTLAPTIRGYTGGPWGSVLAGRLLGRAALGPDAPFHRLPAAGGADVLRGAPDGRWRGPVLAAADLELRRRVSHSIEVAVFGDGAWVRDLGVHPGGGAGVRLVLPPRGLDVVRLDVAASDAGWAVITGFGEAF